MLALIPFDIARRLSLASEKNCLQSLNVCFPLMIPTSPERCHEQVVWVLPVRLPKKGGVSQERKFELLAFGIVDNCA